MIVAAMRSYQKVGVDVLSSLQEVSLNPHSREGHVSYYKGRALGRAVFSSPKVQMGKRRGAESSSLKEVPPLGFTGK